MKHLFMSGIRDCCRASLLHGFPGAGHHGNLEKELTEDEIYEDIRDGIRSGSRDAERRVTIAFTIPSEQAAAERALKRAGFYCVTPIPPKDPATDVAPMREMNLWVYNTLNNGKVRVSLVEEDSE